MSAQISMRTFHFQLPAKRTVTRRLVGTSAASDSPKLRLTCTASQRQQVTTARDLDGGASDSAVAQKQLHCLPPKHLRTIAATSSAIVHQHALPSLDPLPPATGAPSSGMCSSSCCPITTGSSLPPSPLHHSPPFPLQNRTHALTCSLAILLVSAAPMPSERPDRGALSRPELATTTWEHAYSASRARTERLRRTDPVYIRYSLLRLYSRASYVAG